jgi:hypothetical protein
MTKSMCPGSPDRQRHPRTFCSRAAIRVPVLPSLGRQTGLWGQAQGWMCPTHAIRIDNRDSGQENLSDLRPELLPVGSRPRSLERRGCRLRSFQGVLGAFPADPPAFPERTVTSRASSAPLLLSHISWQSAPWSRRACIYQFLFRTAIALRRREDEKL